MQCDILEAQYHHKQLKLKYPRHIPEISNVPKHRHVAIKNGVYHVCGYPLKETLAPGDFGTVYKARSPGDMTGKSVCAIKQVSREVYDKQNYNKAFHYSIQLKLEPFVFRPYRNIEDDSGQVFIITPYAWGGNIKRFAERRGGLNEEQMKFFTCEIVHTLIHIHKKGFIHLDIKPENVLLDHRGHIVISDFNHALSAADSCLHSAENPSEDFNEGSDWWALGLLWMQLVGGYKVETQKGEPISQQRGRLDLPSPYNLLAGKCSVEAMDFVRDMLEGNVCAPTMKNSDLRDHFYLKDEKWFLIEAKDIVPPFNIPLIE